MLSFQEKYETHFGYFLAKSRFSFDICNNYIKLSLDTCPLTVRVPSNLYRFTLREGGRGGTTHRGYVTSNYSYREKIIWYFRVIDVRYQPKKLEQSGNWFGITCS